MAYLDYLATTPVCDEASLVMISMLSDQRSPKGAWGNPGSSHHQFGQIAKLRLEEARAEVGAAVGANSPEEICFESGSTESINHAIRGLFPHPTRGHVVTSEVEHPAVMETVRGLGVEFTLVPPNPTGVVPPERVAAACIRGKTRLVSIMLVNNEVGSVMDWREIARLVKLVDEDILLHCDASQAVGKIPVDVQRLGADLLTIAGHKLYGPKGVGATWIRPEVQLNPLLCGAGHELGRRPGTENVLLCVGLAEAIKHTDLAMAGELGKLRDLLFKELAARLPPGTVVRNGPALESERIPHCLSVSFTGKVLGSDIAARCWLEHRVAFSAGAACHSGKRAAPSRVLKAMRMDDALALSTIRLSVGRYTTTSEVLIAAKAIAQVVLDLQ
ncbi:hypothetical protein BASA81_006896 [Batrachochytrium salamandrivorans]|nr:hypothetical protein BASA81_006896 [Batrachochytrium salamandrivorans]